MLKPDSMVNKDKGMLNNKYSNNDKNIAVKNADDKYKVSSKFIKILK